MIDFRLRTAVQASFRRKMMLGCQLRVSMDLAITAVSDTLSIRLFSTAHGELS